MTDDRFDRELADRLRAYESRVPDEPAPEPGFGRSRRIGLPVLLVGGTVALAAVVLALLVIQGWGRQDIGDPGPSPSVEISLEAEPSPDPVPSMTPTASSTGNLSTPGSSSPDPSPSATSPPATTDLAWSTTGSFPSDGGHSMVQHLAFVGGSYVAAGIAYSQPLPNVGPTPLHALRIWQSPDGREWQVITLGPEFDNVEFTSLVERTDRSLLATGYRSTIGEFGSVATSDPAAWTSQDGRTWRETESGLPGTPVTVVQGGRGYLALVRGPLTSDEYDLWHSADAATWELVRSLEASRIDIGAGDEGFVAAGRTGGGSDEPFAIASADGREWLQASSPPPTYVPLVAALAGDWIAMSMFDGDASLANGETWASVNGLEWDPHGQAPMEGIETDGTECREYPRDLESAGPWLVASTDLSGPCSEGGFAVHGSQLISTDGALWRRLPFDVGTVGESRSGASINAAMVAGRGLILVGEQNGAATFWIGETR